MPLYSARSRHEVLCIVPVGTGERWRENDSTPAKSPNLNAFAERWVRSVKQECLSKLILFGEGPLSRVPSEYSRHYHHERNHQGKSNRLLFPDGNERFPKSHSVECRHRLGGLLKYYRRAA
jgi:putative transposase